MPFYIGGGVALLAVVAGVVYFVVTSTPGTPRELKPLEPIGVTTTSDTGLPGTKTTDTKAATQEVKPAGPKPEEIVAQAKAKLISSAQETRTLRAHTRRLAAVAAILAGDEKTGLEQIGRLSTAEPNTNDDKIVPLVALAWRQLARKESAADATLKQALDLSKDFEPRGRFRSEAALHLAALLAASNRPADAWKLLASGSAGSVQDSFTTAVESARAARTFDLDATLPGRSIGGWEHPQAVGVTLLLCGRGRWSEAQAWVKSAPASIQGELGVVFGEAYARHLLAAKQPLEAVTAFAQELPPDFRGRLLARIAAQQLALKDEAGALAMLAAAQQAMGEARVPEAPKVQTLVELDDATLPDPAPWHSAALAWADIGLVQERLRQTEPAWKSLRTSLDLIAQTAPPPNVAADLKRQAGEVREIRELFKQSNDEKARAIQRRLRPLADDLVKRSAVRQSRQRDVYLAAIDAGLLEPVWSDLQKSREWISLGLYNVLASRATAAGNAELSASVAERIPQDLPLSPPAVREESRRQLDLGNVPGTLAPLASFAENAADPALIYEWRMALVCRAVKAGKYDAAAALLSEYGSPDPTLQAEGLRTGAALATSLGHRAEFLAAARKRLTQPAHEGALDAGVVDALTPLPGVATP